MESLLRKSLTKVAEYYDERKVGNVGPLGFRRSTELKILLKCIERLLDEEIISLNETKFLDFGCADGRVNVFLSYLVKTSVGVELDEWTLEESEGLRKGLEPALKKGRLMLPPKKNTWFFHGDAMDEKIHDQIATETGVALGEFDLFYTYLVMHEEFAGLISEKARKGSIFMVYGLNKIMPRYDGLQLLDHISPMEGILAFYRKD